MLVYLIREWWAYFVYVSMRTFMRSFWYTLDKDMGYDSVGTYWCTDLGPAMQNVSGCSIIGYCQTQVMFDSLQCLFFLHLIPILSVFSQNPENFDTVMDFRRKSVVCAPHDKCFYWFSFTDFLLFAFTSVLLLLIWPLMQYFLKIIKRNFFFSRDKWEYFFFFYLNDVTKCAERSFTQIRQN